MHKRRPGFYSEVEIDKVITPMLDMVFQLLVFFIITYHPSAMEMQIDGTLLPPKDKPIPAAPKDPTIASSPKDPEPKLEETLTVVVDALTAKDGVDKKYIGTPKSIKLLAPENVGGKAEVIFNNDKGEDLEKGLKLLEGRIKKILADNPASGDTDVNIKGDPELAWEYMLSVQDICRARYGVRTVGGKEELTRVYTKAQEAEFPKVRAFKGVGYVQPELPKQP
jgi:hypothetical protein